MSPIKRLTAGLLVILTLGLGQLACSESDPAPQANVVVTVVTTGAAPAITTLSISVDGADPLPIVINDTLRLRLSTVSHSFHLVLTPHNCPASNRPDPYAVVIQSSPDPFPVAYSLDCL